MSHRALLLVLASLALAACSAEQRRVTPATGGELAAARRVAPVRAVEQPALPGRGRLTAAAHRIAGPRVMAASTHGRYLEMHGAAGARVRVLVAGCANGRRCAGTRVVHAANVGCPPPDADVWYFPTLTPRGTDLDAAPRHPGAAAWRQAVADLAPRYALVFRTGPAAHVRVSGPDIAAARHFARRAKLPLDSAPAQGLTAWTARGRPRAPALVGELPERITDARAIRIAYALDRLTGTRFAAGALQERRRLLRLTHGL